MADTTSNGDGGGGGGGVGGGGSPRQNAAGGDGAGQQQQQPQEQQQQRRGPTSGRGRGRGRGTAAGGPSASTGRGQRPRKSSVRPGRSQAGRGSAAGAGAASAAAPGGRGDGSPTSSRDGGGSTSTPNSGRSGNTGPTTASASHTSSSSRPSKAAAAPAAQPVGTGSAPSSPGSGSGSSSGRGRGQQRQRSAGRGGPQGRGVSRAPSRSQGQSGQQLQQSQQSQQQQQSQRRPGRGRGRSGGAAAAASGGRSPPSQRRSQQGRGSQSQGGRSPQQRGPSRRSPPNRGTSPSSGDGFTNEGGAAVVLGSASTSSSGRDGSVRTSRRPVTMSSRSPSRPSNARQSSRNASPNANDPGRLYAMLEAGLPKGEGAPGGGVGGSSDGEHQHDLTRAEETRRTERLNRTYKAAREWIAANDNPDVRRETARFLGTSCMTPLHMLCKLPDPPVDLLVDVMECAPETVRWAESSGWLPLHIAVAGGASLAVLEVLCAADPDSKVAQDRRRRTPLHFAFFRDDVRSDAGKSKMWRVNDGELDRGYDSDWDDLDIGTGEDADIVALLSDTGAPSQHDENGMLPLHYASAYGTSTGVLGVLLDSHPNSIRAREKNGRTPLHLAMVNAHRPASPAVIRRFLSVPDGNLANMTDKEGNLPLHLLANTAARFKPDQKEAHTYATESLKLYLKSGPRASSEFFTALQRLPSWLQDHAVVSPHVQGILNNKIAKRFPTSVLLLDGYVLIMLIVCFDIASICSIDARFSDTSYDEPVCRLGFVYAVLAGGGYFFIREIIQAFALFNTGSGKTWIFSLSNWLDAFMMGLVLSMGAAMINYDIMSPDLFRSLAALTKGILWVSFILYVKSTLVDFAVFVGGVQYVLRRLAAFLVALTCVLLAFAFMFYYVFTMTPFCVPDEEGNYAFPHCTVTDSLLRVYSMMTGEVDDRIYQTLISQILYVLYAFIVIILLSNVLIAIVTDSYGIIKNERAAMVFWSNRLNFIAEVDAIASVRKQLLGEGHLVPRPYSSSNFDSNSSDADRGKSRSKRVFRNLWGKLTGLFKEDPYEYMDVSPSSFDFWCYLLLRIAAFFIIPVWLLLGLATAGFLWPPQVREKLLCQTAVKISRADIAEKAKKEANKLRHELRNLKREVMLEKKIDRRELAEMKTGVQDLQRDVMSDLNQVKEIMTTLLDLEREKAQQ